MSAAAVMHEVVNEVVIDFLQVIEMWQNHSASVSQFVVTVEQALVSPEDRLANQQLLYALCNAFDVELCSYEDDDDDYGYEGDDDSFVTLQVSTPIAAELTPLTATLVNQFRIFFMRILILWKQNSSLQEEMIALISATIPKNSANYLAIRQLIIEFSFDFGLDGVETYDSKLALIDEDEDDTEWIAALPTPDFSPIVARPLVAGFNNSKSSAAQDKPIGGKEYPGLGRGDTPRPPSPSPFS